MATSAFATAPLCIETPAGLLYGLAPHPVACGRGVVIGGGEILPEINFTLPAISIQPDTWTEVRRQYAEMIDEICVRAVALQTPGLVVECELLPPMCSNPAWSGEITAILREALDRYHDSHQLRSALRMTVIDLRDGERPPRLRSGPGLDQTLASFAACIANGADLLSIESTGGKEVHDDVLLAADLQGILFALGVLGARDMRFLWGEIARLAQGTRSLLAGDSACGFANTAMVLADRGMLPRTLAAVVRVASVVRSLQAFEAGAVGPSKDCAYEGPFIKALTGVPIAMEGKSAACAHLSCIGNIAAATADLWSNESVQNVRLLSASAPVVSVEQLIYDCRLMNTAARSGPDGRRQMAEWLVASDAALDPQAWVLRPDFVLEACRAIRQTESPLDQTIAAARAAVGGLRAAADASQLDLSPVERRWLDRMVPQLDQITSDPDELHAIIADRHELRFLPAEYGLSAN